MASVYLTSVKNISNLPEDGIKLLIARKRLDNMKGINWVLELAPSKRLFWDYKKDIISWEQYEKRYKNELKDNLKILMKIKMFIDNGINVSLICYCDDYNYCHRKIVGERIEDMGINVIFN